MNILRLGLCLLPSFLLVIFSFGFVRSSPDCKGKDCRSGIACPGPYNCSCVSSISGEYELLCPKVGESVLSASIMQNKYVQIQCTYSTRYTDYELLNGLKVGSVSAVNFRLCPLPHMSLAELTRTIGVNATNTLLFQSYRNLSNSLERKHLTGLGNITRLLLSSNGLTDLPEDLLQGLFNLTWLDLRGNNVHLHKHFFNSVPKLEVLELGNNDLTRLEVGVFANLTKLKFLNLWKNELKNLTRDVFSDLVSLEQLDISSNGLQELPVDVFQDLGKLVKLSIYANNFSSIPEGLLSATPKLEVIRLYDNKQSLTLPDYFLANLTQLKEVYLMRNNHSSIPDNIFWNSPSIANVSLQGNSLKKLPQDLFRDQIYLQTLDLSYNQLEEIPNYIFKNLARLQFLRLGYNRLQNISRDVFQGLNELESLDLEHNRLNYLDSEAFGPLQQLKHARLSHNFLSFVNEEGYLQGGLSYTDMIGNQSPFRHCFNLENLYLANNSIGQIFDDWRLNLLKLKVLDIGYNRIQHLTIQDIQFITDDISVDLRNNNISVINLQGIEALAVGQWDGPYNPRRTKRNVRVLLEGNPLHCDCRAYELVRYFENKLQPEVNLLVTLKPGNLTCDKPRSLRGVLVKNVDSKDLLCPLEEEPCPSGCDCLLRRADWGLIVNCTERGLTKVPETLPRVRYTNHTELILDNNLIEKTPNFTNSGYANVTHLYLSNNNISEIDVGFLSPQLQVLTVDNNNITKLSSGILRFLSNSTEIRLLTLHHNPWVCDCSARDLLNLIQQKFKQIPFLSNVTCTPDNRPLSKLSVSDLCPVSMVVIVSCVAVAAFGIIIGSIAALYYRYQREVKVWLYSHRFCLWFVTEQELDKDKLYDAFVSYSHKDEQFVINNLVPELESGETPYKLCLHYRDWIAGEWIPNQIARSVEDSRRTLVVLSPNFLESVWGRMEFRAAHKQALNEGRARVIVILYGDVGPTDQLDPELRAYMSMNTYVKWGDPWFWGKLKYALPHPPSLVKNNLNLLKRRGSRKEKKYLDDKLELIHTLDSPTTPPGATTPPAEAAVTTMETFTPIPNGNNIGNGQLKALA